MRVRSGLVYYQYPWPDFQLCLPAEPKASKCDAAVTAECSAPFDLPCDDAPDGIVEQGMLASHDFVVDLSIKANMAQSGNRGIKALGLMRGCAALSALDGGCLVPGAEFLCAKTCGKCSQRTVSCLDCYTKPAFPVCYGKDAQLLPQCAKCLDSCNKCDLFGIQPDSLSSRIQSMSSMARVTGATRARSLQTWSPS
jgi:hypothetical protein